MPAIWENGTCVAVKSIRNKKNYPAYTVAPYEAFFGESVIIEMRTSGAKNRCRCQCQLMGGNSLHTTFNIGTRSPQLNNSFCTN